MWHGTEMPPLDEAWTVVPEFKPAVAEVQSPPGVAHGAEAEELRAGVEKIMREFVAADGSSIEERDTAVKMSSAIAVMARPS